MKLNNLLLILLLIFNLKLWIFAIQKSYFNENLEGTNIGIEYYFNKCNLLKNYTSIFFKFLSDKMEVIRGRKKFLLIL